MANSKNDKGAIHNQDDDVRHDSGEALKDDYESGDAYEKDKIEVRGIVFFTLGLVLLVGATFGLMYLLLQGLKTQNDAGEKGQQSVMMMSKEENLPPEPRLQAAPGFGVQREDGKRVNLELREPQSEYRELRKDWQKVWAEGRKDPKTGTTITMPIEDAKKKVLQEGIIKTRNNDQAQEAAKNVRLMPSYSSSGRAEEVRRQ